MIFSQRLAFSVEVLTSLIKLIKLNLTKCDSKIGELEM